MYKNKKKILILSISIAILIIIAIGLISFIIYRNKKNKITYEDKISNKNYFVEMKINLDTKEVERDNKETSLNNEFNITEEEEKLVLSTKEELINFFNDTVFELEIKDKIVHIKNEYQSKKIVIEANGIQNDFKANKIDTLQDGLFLLEYDTQKHTKMAFEYFKTVDWIKNIQLDTVWHIDNINDESQTVYGEKNNESDIKYNTYGIQAMGIDNYKSIINDNGSASEVIVATLGYGIRYENTYFKDRIHDNYYNFIEDSKNINETIPQGSRIAEVIKEATADNVKIMPLVVVNSEGYTTISAIVKAIEYGIKNSDVICYELIHENNYIIDLALQNAFNENIPVSCVTAQKNSNNENYPANNDTTIAVSSIDKNSKISTYSGKGQYIDFAAYSTDVKEILDTNIGVSRWSGAQYSNAHIVAQIALIKSYKKDFTILQIYNVLKSYCKDIGEKGKDNLYGYGFPDFSNLKISDLDKVSPEITEIKFDNEKWEKSKQIQIIGSDNIRVYGWAITTSQDKPDKWNKISEIKPTIDVTTEINENNKYFVWITDSASNTAFKEIEISKIDSTAPTINYDIDISKIETDKYVTITVNAEDNDSGLHAMAYSWDKINWGADRNTLKVTENGKYKVYVRDALENISEKNIKVDVFPTNGIANVGDGTIIKKIVVSPNWNGNVNKSVRITFNNNQNIIGWNLTDSKIIPQYFETVYLDDIDDNEIIENSLIDESENSELINDITQEIRRGFNMSFTVSRALKTGIKYYVWIKNINEDIKYQTFTISKMKI